MSTPDDMFERFRDWRVMLGFYEMRESVSVEELYLAFKARMQAEPPLTRVERIAQLHAEIDRLIASDSDSGECD